MHCHCHCTLTTTMWQLMTKSKNKTGIEDFIGWTGSFEALIDNANQVLAPTGAPTLTPRAARHYQQTRLLGHGRRTGRAATFGYADLCDLVGIKSLASRNFSLDQVSAIKSAAPPGALADTALNSYANVAGANHTPAQAVVSGMLAAAGLSISPPQSPNVNLALMSSLAKSSMPQALRMASPHQPDRHLPPPVPAMWVPPQPLWQHQHISPWLEVNLDNSGMHLATPSQRAQAARALRALADTMKPPSLTSTKEQS